MPQIDGGLFGFELTVMLNAGSVAVFLPSLTEMRICEYVPAEPSGGMPLSRPELAVNVAQDGLPLMLKTRLLPSGSLAVGWKP